MSAIDTIRPFDSGAQLSVWRDRNCHGCTKYNLDRYDGQCEIDGAVGRAYIGDGTVTAEIGQRMGYRSMAWSWDCPERDTR